MIRSLARLFSRLFIFVSLMSLIAFIVSAMWFQHIWNQPSLQSSDRLIIIEKGTNHSQLARYLHDESLLPSRWIYAALRFGFTVVEQESFAPKAGEFLIPAQSSYAELFQIIDQGIPFQHRFTVREGGRSQEVVVALLADERMKGAILRVPEEGSLAPDTYFFERGTERQELLSRMQARQEMIVAEEWASRNLDLPFDTAKEAIMLASIIEKESGLVIEQPLVSSVFINRLMKDMRLESDATVLYGIVQKEGQPREVLRKDTKADGPWNTYRRKGFPKTAIGNPSRAAIRAALNPMPSTYYYFVADGQGGHNFAKTYEEHLKNVKAYRKLKAK